MRKDKRFLISNEKVEKWYFISLLIMFSSPFVVVVVVVVIVYNNDSFFIFYECQSQHSQERFELAVKHLLEHENFSSENASCIVREEKTLDGDRSREEKAQLHHPQMHQPRARNEKEGKTKQSIDLL